MVKSNSKKASKQPYADKEQLELIISALNTGLALIDPDMTLVWANNINRKLQETSYKLQTIYKLQCPKSKTQVPK